MDALDDLASEHRFLEHVLEALDECVEAAASGSSDARADLAAFAEVLAEIDRCWHQAAEEQLLIPVLREHGMPEGGLLEGVKREHDQERELVRSLREAAHDHRVLPSRLTDLVYSYTDHTRCHIYTEETLLFPAARSRLPPTAMLELTRRLQAFVASARIVALRERAARLSVRYAAPPACIDPRVTWHGTDD